MMDGARARFPSLVGALLLFGAPLGLMLGAVQARTRVQSPDAAERFSWWRALTCGGLAGLVGGCVFAWWLWRSGQSVAVATLIGSRSPLVGLALHFTLALVIGGSFGLFFQQDVRAYGSSMGWGMAYGMFWWFVGPLTLLALAQGRVPDWSVDRARQLFDLLPAHIVYGLLLGLIYAAFDQLWVTLFIESDPIRRQPEGPGARTLRSLGRGALAGLAGGIAFIPMIAGIDGFQRIATLVGGTSFSLGMTLHLVVAILIGMSYGWLFERESPDIASGVGWGLLYGLGWWFLGPFTLFQTILGRPFTWSPEAVANFAALAARPFALRHYHGGHLPVAGAPPGTVGRTRPALCGMGGAPPPAHRHTCPGPMFLCRRARGAFTDFVRVRSWRSANVVYTSCLRSVCSDKTAATFS